MSGGAELFGGAAPTKRGPGRPKGSKNRRAADLKGFIDARYGGSAALQVAQLCLVTPAELKRAGGSMAKAQVTKAVDLVEHVREAQDGFDDRLRQVVREELRELAAELADGGRVRDLVAGFLHRIREGSSRFGLKEAMDLIARERAALLPYTDQRQPLAVEQVGERAPAVVFMGAAPIARAATEIIGEFEVIEPEVSRPKSHANSQATDFQGLPLAAPADDKSAGPPAGG